FAVAASNEVEGVGLMQQLRALGAPRSFEIARDGRIFHWRVSRNPTIQDRQGEYTPGQVAAVFASHRDRWSPDALFQQRLHPAVTQQDFFDLGLIPALEEHIRERLGPSVTGILEQAGREYEKRTKRPPNPETLYRLLFRGITGKVLRDRRHGDFREFELG